ncbi:MAG: hypothetical protein PHY02_05515 [Phycisphaerae bacterium]|nr:hypothetical protein [Phycisphaerae bacterium]
MFTKKQKMGVAFLTLLAASLMVSCCFAEEDETVELKGFVGVIKDANEAIISVQLTTDEGVYEVELDAEGLALAENIEGAKVSVEGIVYEEDNQMWLKVLTFEAVEEEPEA